MTTLFRRAKPVIGMLHLPALPGSPASDSTLEQIRLGMLRDAGALMDGGVDGLMVENIGDAPFYPSRVPPHTVAFLAVLAHELKRAFARPLGVNVLRNDGISAVAVAEAAGADFIRVNVYTGARVADQGILEGEAHELQRYRKLLGSRVQVWADVAVKHSAALGVRDLADEVEDTVLRARADAIVVSGSGTGKQTPIDVICKAKAAAGIAPVFIGSGASAETAAELLRFADGLIVGTWFKAGGILSEPVDSARVRRLMDAVNACRTD
ncbi:MAG: BtpA/SgcQ family protein [Bryobacteraceae bacterium]|nr:BtpA/SgcQ family protein [Bryobacteraceae bacterium]